MAKNILVICDGFLPPKVKVAGGKNLYLMQRYLSSKDFMMHLVVFTCKQTVSNWQEWKKSQEKQYNIKFHVFDIPVRKIYPLHFFLAKLLSFFVVLYLQIVNKFDLIHEYSSMPFLVNRTYLLSLLTGTKTVHTLCTINRSFLGSEKLLLKSTDKVICAADNMRRRLGKRLPKQKVDFIPIPIEDSFFCLPKSDSKQKFGIRTNKAVLFCGLLDGRKGITSFLRAIPGIIEKNSDASIVIVTAPGLNTSPVARQNREKVLSALKHYGRMVVFMEKEVDMPSLFAVVDVFVYPLLTMHGTLGSPSILVEAMATGKAIVASNLEEISDIITHEKDGLLFNPGDSKELARCVNKLLGDGKLRESLGKQARQKSKKYSLPEVSNRIMSLYNTLIQKRK